MPYRRVNEIRTSIILESTKATVRNSNDNNGKIAAKVRKRRGGGKGRVGQARALKTADPSNSGKAILAGTIVIEGS